MYVVNLYTFCPPTPAPAPLKYWQIQCTWRLFLVNCLIILGSFLLQVITYLVVKSVAPPRESLITPFCGSI